MFNAHLHWDEKRWWLIVFIMRSKNRGNHGTEISVFGSKPDPMNLPKHCICLFLSIFFAFLAHASTPVSGIINGAVTWTPSGSPYLIQSHVYVNGTLVIQPGVEVLFEGSYKIDINGTFVAKGTALSPILFASDDTTGFHLSGVNTGGWQGIYFDSDPNFQNSDSSAFEHCIIRDVKTSGPAPNDAGPINSKRGMEVRHCEFYNNWCQYGTGAVIQIWTNGNGRNAVIDNCNFHDNRAYKSLMVTHNSQGGDCEVTNNTAKRNTRGTVLITTRFDDMLIEFNEIDSNDIDQSYGALTVWDCNSIIRNNRITQNSMFEQGAILCKGGKNLIEKNLICNNHAQFTPQLCGPTEGGGGIHLTQNGSQQNFNDIHHTVRDNVIANNSGVWGGGIYVWQSTARIFNNTIVNNSCYLQGSSIYVSSTSKVYIHNNLFGGNISTFAMGATNNHVNVSTAALEVAYDYNFDPLHSFQNSLAYSGSNFIGDSTHCISGSGANMVNPTTSALITQNAVVADFRLTDSSLCINAGTTDTNLLYGQLDATDHAGEPRISGTSVDIGAHELQWPPECSDTALVQSFSECSDSFTWINGVTYTQSSSLVDSLTFAGSNGCDSTVVLDLALHSTQEQVQSFTECSDSFTWINGVTYTQSSSLTDSITYTNANGCDSTLVLDLTLNHLQAAAFLSNNTLICTQAGVQYQWLDCENNMAPIAGATGSSFTPTASAGQYAVVTSIEECSDTSDCIEGPVFVGMSMPNRTDVQVFPNPANDRVSIVSSHTPIEEVTIFDGTGRLVLSKQIAPASQVELALNLDRGYYVMVINPGSGLISTCRLVVH